MSPSEPIPAGMAWVVHVDPPSVVASMAAVPPAYVERKQSEADVQPIANASVTAAGSARGTHEVRLPVVSSGRPPPLGMAKHVVADVQVIRLKPSVT